jgi:chromosomal replication initiation ATPase DnaA
MGIEFRLIVYAVAIAADIPSCDILSTSRKAHLVRCRSAIAWLARKYQRNSTYQRLGRQLGMHHSSVMNLVQRVEVERYNIKPLIEAAERELENYNGQV